MRLKRLRDTLGHAGFLALVLSLSGSLLAAQALNTDKAGLAISGYDPVAYFTVSQAQKGVAGISATHAGATYYFASAANRDAFLANPENYLPTYGGYCAYGVAHGHKVDVDPEAFRVVNDKLYLNYSKGVQKKWLADIPGNITSAEGNWPKLKDAPRD